MNPTASAESTKGDRSDASKMFDIGGKGFLTPAERTAREMDFKEDQGCLSNEQVVSLVERTEDLRKSNKTLRQWLVGVLCVTITFGAAQIATTIAAARFSKDANADPSTGLLTVKGSDTPVVVVSTGRTIVIDLEEDGTFCVPVSDMVDMFSSTIHGSPTNAIFQTHQGDKEDGEDVSDVRIVSWLASGTFYNRTSACINTAEKGLYCFDYDPCGEEGLEDDSNRRLSLQNSHRNTFHREMKRLLLGPVGGDLGGGGFNPGNPGYNPGCGAPPCPEDDKKVRGGPPPP